MTADSSVEIAFRLSTLGVPVSYFDMRRATNFIEKGFTLIVMDKPSGQKLIVLCDPERGRWVTDSIQYV